MASNPRRIVGIFALMLGIWVVIYWMYPPSTPPITYGRRPEGLEIPKVLASVDAEGGRPERPASQPIVKSVPAAGSGQGSTAAPSPKGPIQVVEKPKFKDYVVRPGDTSFAAIAARPEVYGNKKLANAIRDANPLVSPDKLKPGKTVLHIPLDPNNIQGRPVTITPGADKPSGAESAPPAGKDTAKAPASRPEAAPAGEEYVVQAGDTLSGIAKAKYGKSALWTAILEANAGVLDDPGKVKPGMKLRLPPAPKGD